MFLLDFLFLRHERSASCCKQLIKWNLTMYLLSYAWPIIGFFEIGKKSLLILQPSSIILFHLFHFNPLPVLNKNSQSHGPEWLHFYFVLSGRISRNIGENIFPSYTGSTSENTDFHVLVAQINCACLTTRWKYDVIYLKFLALDMIL